MGKKTTILLAGASGFIGRALTQALVDKGYLLHQLVRHHHEHDTQQVKQFYWDLENGDVQAGALGNEENPLHAVICLSGAGIADGIWTQKRKQTLENSRTQPLQTLINELEKLPENRRPAKLIAASAVGYYGADASANNQEITENSPAGTDFLAHLCEKWETAAKPATDLGISVTHLRTGLVMHPNGGLLKTFDRLYHLGLGAQLGDGENWMPLITRRDHVRAIIHLLESSQSAGAFNLVGPRPVTGKEFHQFMAERTHRPKWLKIPGKLLSLAPEQVQLLALASQRALPIRLQETGFTFKDPDVLKALETERLFENGRIIA